MSSEPNKEMDRKSLLRLVSTRFLMGIILIGAILFLSAGSLEYWNGWLFLVALVIPMSGTMRYLLKNAPELLAKRMRLKEPQKKQRAIVKVASLFMLIAFIMPGIDYRYQWSDVPFWLVMASLLLFEIAYALFIVAMTQNSYASRVVEIQEGQKLIDTGIYSVMRHPMYMASILLYLAMPLLLGSYYALIPMAVTCAEIIARIKNEEDVLKAGLAGYKEYTQKVKYRLIPFVW